MVADDIKNLRRETGLTQREFAKRYHIKNLATLTHWEQGISKPPDYVVFLLSRVIFLEKKLGLFKDE